MNTVRRTGVDISKYFLMHDGCIRLYTICVQRCQHNCACLSISIRDILDGIVSNLGVLYFSAHCWLLALRTFLWCIYRPKVFFFIILVYCITFNLLYTM
jgi:hypothetical protein